MNNKLRICIFLFSFLIIIIPLQVHAQFKTGDYLIIKTDKYAYFTTEPISVFGQVKLHESNSVVSIQIFDPTNSRIEIKQIVPDLNKTFFFTIMTDDNKFKKEGLYKIVAQYGVKRYYAETSFKISKLNVSHIESDYKGLDIYKNNSTFYAIPYVEGGFNILRINSRDHPLYQVDTNAEWSGESQVTISKEESFVNNAVLKIVWNKTQNAVYHNLLIPPDLSDAHSIMFSIYGSNSNSIMRMQVRFNTNTGEDWVEYRWIDNFEGWKTLAMDLDRPTATSGNVNWKDVRQILFHPVGSQSLTLYFDKIVFNNDYGIILKDNSLEGVKVIIDSIPPIGPYLIEEGYKGFNIIMHGGIYYGILQSDGAFDVKRIENGNYSVVIANKSITNVKNSIDDYAPISNDLLLQIWIERADLQSDYPEVAEGNITNLKIWAMTVGWDEDSRLSELIPEGQTPTYLKPSQLNDSQIFLPSSPELQDGMIILLQRLIVVGILIIGIVVAYRFYQSFKKRKLKLT